MIQIPKKEVSVTTSTTPSLLGSKVEKPRLLMKVAKLSTLIQEIRVDYLFTPSVYQKEDIVSSLPRVQIAREEGNIAQPRSIIFAPRVKTMVNSTLPIAYLSVMMSPKMSTSSVSQDSVSPVIPILMSQLNQLVMIPVIATSITRDFMSRWSILIVPSLRLRIAISLSLIIQAMENSTSRLQKICRV